MEVYLIRHTTPLVEKGTCYGQSDLELAPGFETEWCAIQNNLPLGVDAVFSSPLSRCRQLAILLTAHYQVPLLVDARLMELNFGRWEMKAWNDIDSDELTPWMNNYVHEQCPAGESYADLLQRVKVFTRYLQTMSFERIMIVTHAGVIKSFHSVIHSITPEEALLIRIEYGEMHHFTL